MKMKLIVSIDTEADNQWDYGRALTTGNVYYWQPFQKLCERYRIPPTYLVTSEIATNFQAAAFLRPLVETGQAEVGGHLHPWTTPPFRDEPGLRFNDCMHAFPSQLDPQLLQDKLTILTEQITEAIGNPPRSFRAGRFGFNRACAEALCRLGYKVDSSITPLISWEHEEGLTGFNGGPDFRYQPVHPNWIIEYRGINLLEIPVTILLTFPWLQRLPSLLRVYQFLRNKLAGRLMPIEWLTSQPLWLRPFPGTTIRHLCSVWHEAERLGLPVAVMIFHSSELMPGGSPYWPTQKSVHQLLNLLEQFFRFVRKTGADAITLTSATKIAEEIPHLENRSL